MSSDSHMLSSPLLLKDKLMNQTRVISRLSNQVSRGTRNYIAAVHDHFQNPRNVGRLDQRRRDVGTALVGKASCGDVIKLQVQVRDGIVIDARFKTFGCGAAIASSSLATEMVIGKSVESAAALRNTNLVEQLKLPPVKIHCSVLAEEAIKAALLNYTDKQNAAPFC